MGWEAHETCHDLSDNPFPSSSPDALFWVQGWEDRAEEFGQPKG